MSKNLKNLKKSVFRLKEQFGLIFYTQKNLYRCSYQINLKNNSNVTKSFDLVVPLAQETSEQKFISSARGLPMHAFYHHDPTYHNPYAYFRVKLDPQQLEVFQYDFEIAIAPNVFRNIEKFTLDYYRKLDQALYKKYLRAGDYIQPQDARVVALAEKIKGKATEVVEIASRFNRYIVRNIVYGDPIAGLYKGTDGFERKAIDCGGFDTLFVSMCVSVGIPARIVCGFMAGYKENSMHAWAEFLLPNGIWVPVDPSMENLFLANKTRVSGRFGFVGSDRVVFSYGCDFPLLISNNHTPTDILQNAFTIPQDQEVEVTTKFLTNVY